MGTTLSSAFRKAGLKPIIKETTRIRGYHTYSKGDYFMYTEKSFGLHGLKDHQRCRYIDFESKEALEKGKEILNQLDIKILSEWNLKLVTEIY